MESRFLKQRRRYEASLSRALAVAPGKEMAARRAALAALVEARALACARGDAGLAEQLAIRHRAGKITG